MSAICIIPARGGSQRIHRKNIKMFRGQPIIGYAIQAAQKSKLFDEIIVSTDDDEILRMAIGFGANVFLRAFDDGARGTQEVAKQVLSHRKKYEYACVIYPCSPLLTPELLIRGFYILEHDFVRSVHPVTMEDAGCFYWGEAMAFIESVPLGPTTTDFMMPLDQCIDINTMDDWTRAEALYDALQKAKNGNS